MQMLMIKYEIKIMPNDSGYEQDRKEKAELKTKIPESTNEILKTMKNELSSGYSQE